MLLSPVNVEEINDALLSIDVDSSSGFDGMNSLFFRKTWHIIKEDICKTVRDFFA